MERRVGRTLIREKYGGRGPIRDRLWEVTEMPGGRSDSNGKK